MVTMMKSQSFFPLHMVTLVYSWNIHVRISGCLNP